MESRSIVQLETGTPLDLETNEEFQMCKCKWIPPTRVPTAWQEFVANGQDGLDELLAALDGGFEVRANP